MRTRTESTVALLVVLLTVVCAPYLHAQARRDDDVKPALSNSQRWIQQRATLNVGRMNPAGSTGHMIRTESDPTYCDDYFWEEYIYSGGCGNTSCGGDHGYDCKGTYWQTGTQDGHWLEIYGGTCFYFSYSCWEDPESYHLYYEKCSGVWVARTSSQFGNCQCNE